MGDERMLRLIVGAARPTRKRDGRRRWGMSKVYGALSPPPHIVPMPVAGRCPMPVPPARWAEVRAGSAPRAPRQGSGCPLGTPEADGHQHRHAIAACPSAPRAGVAFPAPRLLPGSFAENEEGVHLRGGRRHSTGFLLGVQGRGPWRRGRGARIRPLTNQAGCGAPPDGGVRAIRPYRTAARKPISSSSCQMTGSSPPSTAWLPCHS